VRGESTRNKAEQLTAEMIARHHLFPELVSIVTTFVNTRVVYKQGTDVRELWLEQHRRDVVARIRDDILPAASG